MAMLDHIVTFKLDIGETKTIFQITFLTQNRKLLCRFVDAQEVKYHNLIKTLT